jgi:hypothetical protein
MNRGRIQISERYFIYAIICFSEVIYPKNKELIECSELLSKFELNTKAFIILLTNALSPPYRQHPITTYNTNAANTDNTIAPYSFLSEQNNQPVNNNIGITTILGNCVKIHKVTEIDSNTNHQRLV